MAGTPNSGHSYPRSSPQPCEAHQELPVLSNMSNCGGRVSNTSNIGVKILP